jgi:DNA primase
VIGQDTLDRIRRETDLVALISESLKLVRRGRSFVGLCPFHKEKSPSFHVNPERGFYHCFGCHASGDALKFVQENEGLDFIESVKRLAERAGIEIELDVSEADRRQQLEARRRSDEHYEVMSVAAAWFERMLREHPLSGYAQAELERRALVPTTPTDPIADALQAFRVGYAPYGWEGLAQHLREQKASLAAAERVGLVGARKTGSGYYDRFRHRLMFAVLDVQGRVIAFSGRSLDEPPADELLPLGLQPAAPDADKPAKYYNSPESPIYKKREALFGLYQARAGIRSTDSCVLVEGNFDVLSLHARGIKNVVAPLGTAFTVEQGQQLSRFCPNLVLLFDGDEAGRRATRAAREVCQKVSVSAKVATLPNGVDPDDLIRREGRAGIERVLGAARGLLEYLIDGVLDGTFAESDARERGARVKEVLDLIASEQDPTVRALAERHADRLAQRLNIADAHTFRAVAAEVRRALQSGPIPTQSAVAPVAAPFKARSPERKDAVALEILGALFDFPELFQGPEASEAAELLEGDAAAALAAMRQGWEQDGLHDLELVLAKLAPSIHAFARARLAAPRHMQPKDAQAELSGNVRQLKALALKRDKQATVEQLERARPSGDFKQEDALLEQLFRKARQRRVVAPE